MCLQSAEKDDGTKCPLGKVEMKLESVGRGKGCVLSRAEASLSCVVFMNGQSSHGL